MHPIFSAPLIFHFLYKPYAKTLIFTPLMTWLHALYRPYLYKAHKQASLVRMYTLCYTSAYALYSKHKREDQSMVTATAQDRTAISMRDEIYNLPTLESEI